jgi:hypothetical protein
VSVLSDIGLRLIAVNSTERECVRTRERGEEARISMERPGGRETAPAIGGTTTKLHIHAIAPRPIALVDGRSKCGSASRVEKVSSWTSAASHAECAGRDGDWVLAVLGA